MAFDFIVQQDFPLITWKLNETDGEVLYSDNFIDGYNGLTSTAISPTGSIRSKDVPIIYGSKNSLVISSGYIQVPSLGFMTNRHKNKEMSLEFFIKPITNISVSPRQQLVQLGNTKNGIYIENSSFIAIIGDELKNSRKIIVPIENFEKPFHIVMTYNKKSFGFSVNGKGDSVAVEDGLFKDTYDTYSTANEFFRFNAITGKSYAIDNISLYTYSMDLNTARRHFVYALGYEAPRGLETYYGGYRYSFSMENTPVINKYEQYGDSWLASSKTDNIISDNNVIRIANLPYPSLKYTLDKDKTVFTWGENGLSVADGGFIQINPKEIDTGSGGFGIVCRSLSNDASTQNLLILQDPQNKEFSLKIYARSGTVYYQINNATPATLSSSTSNAVNGDFTVGYFYNYVSDQLTIFYGDSSVNQIINLSSGYNTKLFTSSHASVLRIGTNDSFSENEEFADLDSVDIERFKGTIKRIVQIDTNVGSSVLTDILARLNKYTAIANQEEERFIIKAKATIEFAIDAKRLSGTNNVIGPNKVEWGYDGKEIKSVTVSSIGATNTGYQTYQSLVNEYASPGVYQDIFNDTDYYTFLLNNPEVDWFVQGNAVNRTCISEIVGKDSGITKGIKFTFVIECDDVIDNPFKINWFRLLSYGTVKNQNEYTSEIKLGELPFKYTFINDDVNTSNNNKDFNLPEYRSTPFLWCEEYGGFKVGRTAYIDYTTAPILGDTEGGLQGIGFFINIPDDNTRTILKVKKSNSTIFTLTYNHSNNKLESDSNTKIFLNGADGVAGNTGVEIKTGEWQYVAVKRNSIITVADVGFPRIIFGDETAKADFYIDEIITFSSVEDSDVKIISKAFTATNIELANNNSTGDDFFFSDKEMSNSTEIYQPFPGQQFLQDDVDLATYSALKSTPAADPSGQTTTYTFTYTGPNSILIDGTYMQDKERILLKNQSSSALNGIYVVTVPDDLEPNVTKITLTKQSCPDKSVIYVKDGVSNKGKHFLKVSSSSFPETYIVKKVDAYTYQGPREKTSLEARKTINV